MVGRGRSGSYRSPRTPPADDAHLHVAVMCADDGRTHTVRDVELSSDSATSGRYRALCGHIVTAAPMVAPNGAPCADCRAAESTPTRAGQGSRRS